MIDQTLQYLLTFCLAILFTSIGISRQTIIPNLLAGISWFLVSLATLAFGANGNLTVAMSWLIAGIGILFILNAIRLIIEMLTGKRISEM